MTKNDFVCGENVFILTVKRASHKRSLLWRKKVRHTKTGSLASRTLTPDVIREVQCAKSRRQVTAARPKHNSDHGYILFATVRLHPAVFIAALHVFVRCSLCTYVYLSQNYWSSAFCMQVQPCFSRQPPLTPLNRSSSPTSPLSPPQ